MNTVVILGAGCSKGLADLPTDNEFICKCENEICGKYFLNEALDWIYKSTFKGSIIPKNLWREERLEVCWNEIDENYNRPKIILNSPTFDKWAKEFFMLAESESGDYKYYSHYYYKMPLSLSPYQFLFLFAGWELKKLVAKVYSKLASQNILKKYELLIKKIRKISDDSKQTFVSFNYDTLLEQSLGQFNYVGLNNPKQDVFNILKPHGSVNWVDDGNSISELPEPLAIEEIGFHENKLRQHSIVGLVSKKSEFDVDFQKSLNSDVVGCLYGNKITSYLMKSINSAEQLIVIGYSFPFTDGHIRKAFMESKPKSLKKVSLITNDSDEATRISRIVCELFNVQEKNVISYCDGIERWVTNQR
jgi:hypothetical protein